MLTDLRKVNVHMELIDPLQLGLPNLVIIPKKWNTIIIDLKDCFYNIPLREDDREKFAFTITYLNNEHPTKRCQ